LIAVAFFIPMLVLEDGVKYFIVVVLLLLSYVYRNLKYISCVVVVKVSSCQNDEIINMIVKREMPLGNPRKSYCSRYRVAQYQCLHKYRA
jgi:hypothetical protein